MAPCAHQHSAAAGQVVRGQLEAAQLRRAGPPGGTPGDAAGRRRRGAGVEEGLILDWQKRGEEAQQLSSERMTLLEDLGPGSPRLPRLGQDLEHQIFSRLTRNALNSGVRALASPTNGVSALASQYRPWLGSLSAAMPTYPQWMGIPIWNTFWPATVIEPRRLVTTARTSSLPRFDETRTLSPVLMPFV